MKKSIVVLTSCFMLFASVSLFANVKIQKQHKEITGAAKQIKTCADCHNDTTKLEKKKGQNFKALYKTKSCAAKGCHK